MAFEPSIREKWPAYLEEMQGMSPSSTFFSSIAKIASISNAD